MYAEGLTLLPEALHGGLTLNASDIETHPSRPWRERVFKMAIMELELIRTYYPAGTNGKILYQGRLMMYSIELPWKDNLTQVSCIPEGRYELVKRWSLRSLDRHLQVMNVLQRTSILIHPANDAMHELKGCIAPVSLLTGVGKGCVPGWRWKP